MNILGQNLANYAQISQLALKQDVLTSGTGITINGSTISATGTVSSATSVLQMVFFLHYLNLQM